MLSDQWITASESGDCVEARRTEVDRVEVRNSKRPDEATVWFTGSEWREFIAGAQRGVFDLPEWKVSATPACAASH
ncbi:DUF397 domain-containing protein [Nonomuraea sp. LPB2021202275-12-8]|uniref:DUF397 domain-containing protein n=1 Tax=Nonomuraea sp. LPB2021202275-12-8 TaxID=3120159 RepID=UPI003FA5DB05